MVSVIEIIRFPYVVVAVGALTTHFVRNAIDGRLLLHHRLHRVRPLLTRLRRLRLIRAHSRRWTRGNRVITISPLHHRWWRHRPLLRWLVEQRRLLNQQWTSKVTWFVNNALPPLRCNHATNDHVLVIVDNVITRRRSESSLAVDFRHHVWVLLRLWANNILWRDLRALEVNWRPLLTELRLIWALIRKVGSLELLLRDLLWWNLLRWNLMRRRRPELRVLQLRVLNYRRTNRLLITGRRNVTN